MTQLAHGVPVGGELDYLDEGTLAQALRLRRVFRVQDDVDGAGHVVLGGIPFELAEGGQIDGRMPAGNGALDRIRHFDL